VIVPGPEGAPRDDVDSHAEEFLKILEQAHMIKKGGTRLKVHERVQVTAWAGVRAAEGTGAAPGRVSTAHPRTCQGIKKPATPA
jgi:hypothetical protein